MARRNCNCIFRMGFIHAEFSCYVLRNDLHEIEAELVENSVECGILIMLLTTTWSLKMSITVMGVWLAPLDCDHLIIKREITVADLYWLEQHYGESGRDHVPHVRSYEVDSLSYFATAPALDAAVLACLVRYSHDLMWRALERGHDLQVVERIRVVLDCVGRSVSEEVAPVSDWM